MEGLDAEVIVETVDKAVIVVGEETIIANKGSIKRKAILGGEIVTGGEIAADVVSAEGPAPYAHISIVKCCRISSQQMNYSQFLLHCKVIALLSKTSIILVRIIGKTNMNPRLLFLVCHYMRSSPPRFERSKKLQWCRLSSSMVGSNSAVLRPS